MSRYFVILFLIAALSACNGNLTGSNRVIVVQPLGNFSNAQTLIVANKLKLIGSKVIIRNEIQLPSSAYYKPRNRYRADTLIRFLKQFGNTDTVVIGLTNKDISTTKNNFADWGIMGLAYQPGNSCVVSTFRLSKANLNEQFYKVAIHELGHTQGLPHCSKKICFMRDAEGGNPLNEEKDFL